MSHRYALLAGKLLAKAAAPAGARASRDDLRPPSAADRDDAIAAMEQAMSRRRRHAVLRWAWVADVVLLIGAGGWFYANHRAPNAIAVQRAPAPSAITVVGHPEGGGAIVRAPQGAGPSGQEVGSPALLADGKALEAGSRIVTRAGGHVVLTLSTGTRLTVEEGGDLTIVDNGPNQVFSIQTGAVRAEVAKLETGQRFLLRTPDAEIEVHGTSFRVAVADADPSCGAGTITRVTAFEGVVSVRHGSAEAKVSAGQKWPPDCMPPRPLSPLPRVSRAALPVAPSSVANATANAAATAARPPVTEAPAAEPSVPASDLAEQNNSFARALVLKRQGASHEALAAFEGFAARYPASPLLESALIERMRVLRTLDAAKAREAARQYLSRYPAGVARDEARAIELARAPAHGERDNQ
jgi:hypothetical protein